MEGAQIGPYRVLGDLGSGGMGRVYLAEVAGDVPGLDAGAKVALKVVHPHLLETPGVFKRFLREAEIGQRVEQANVVRCFDCDALVVEGREQHFLVMEYVEGQTLRHLLSELGTVPEELCRHVGREIAKGLVAIHAAGAIHRDLKPENVLVTKDHVVKVMDLGVARLRDEAVRLSQTGAFVGSIEYASPEQLGSGAQDLDARADLHALGVLLYELATGRHPYRATDVSTTLHNVSEGHAPRAGDVNPQLSPFFEEVIHTLTATQPDDRFPSAAAVLDVLERGEGCTWWRARATAIRVETMRPLRRIRIPRETALYGRDDDLARIREAYAEAKARHGRVLLIEGEAGIGKTRLIDEAVGRLRQEGEDLDFLFGAHLPGGAATAAGAFARAFCEHFEVEALEETLAPYLSRTPALVPAFAALLRGETMPAGAEPLTKGSLQTVFVHATQSLAAERPTIVLIDDLHFAPEEGLALFASLALAVPEHRILLVGTMRPGVSEAWIANVERWEHATCTQLARLGPKDLARLLEDAFHSRRLAEELGIRIARKSDGNPFFAFEIIQGLRDGDFIRREVDGTWVTTRDVHDIRVPSSVIDLVKARMADLDEDEQDLLEVAACAGFEFDPVLVAEAAGLQRVPALKRFGRIEKRRRLVRSAGRQLTFDHHQVQEALYEGILEPLRETYHAAIAEALEQCEGAAEGDPADLDGRLCADLCDHFLSGAKGDRALRYLDRALDHLGGSYENDRAIALADRALAVPALLAGSARFEVLLHENDRLDLLGRREAQGTVLEEARAIVEETGDRGLAFRVEGATAVWLTVQGRFEEAVEQHVRARDLARELGDRAGEAAATGDLGNVYRMQGRFDEAKAHYEDWLSAALDLGDRRTEAVARGSLGNLALARGAYTEAEAHLRRSLSILREIGDRRREGAALGNLGGALYRLGRYADAREHFEQAVTHAREIGDRRGESLFTGNLGLVALARGRYDDAREHFGKYLSVAREIGDRWGEGTATVNLGVAHTFLGATRDAASHFERALGIAREIGDQPGEAFALFCLGDVLRVWGRPDEAWDRFTSALTLTREIGAPREEQLALHGLARVAETRADAVALREEALAIARELGDTEVVAEILALGAASQDADAEPADDALAEALDAIGEASSPDLVLLVRSQAAGPEGGALSEALSALEAHEERARHETRLRARHRLWHLTDDHEHLAAAKQLLDRLVAQAPDEHRISMCENVRLHRAIQDAWNVHEDEAQQVEPGES